VTWTRLDDGWTERADFADLTFETRWHYLAMIQFCSRTGRLDGVMRRSDARRCSDVDDPDTVIRTLLATPFLEETSDGLRIIEIHDHVPPPSVRMNAENSKVRMRRHRAHKAGDHSLCLADQCGQGVVTPPVTRNPGTGRDGTGQALKPSPLEEVDDWPTVAPIPRNERTA